MYLGMGGVPPFRCVLLSSLTPPPHTPPLLSYLLPTSLLTFCEQRLWGGGSFSKQLQGTRAPPSVLRVQRGRKNEQRKSDTFCFA